MMLAILLAFGLIILLAFFSRLKPAGHLAWFTTAGRSFGGLMVGASLTASAIGASSTLGLADLTARYQAAGFWWLGLGALGLFLMSLLTLKPLWELRVVSIAEAVKVLAGEPASRLTSLVIIISWIGIIATQLVAIGKVGSLVIGLPSNLLVVLVGLGLISYTVLGGQESVIRADLFNLVLLLSALVTAFFFMSDFGELSLQPLLNQDFGADDLILLAIPLLGAYLVGPDMFSRINSAQTLASARRGLVFAGVSLMVVGAVLTSLSLMFADMISGPGNPLLLGMLEILPSGLGYFFAAGLIAAMISSADTCLLTVGVILGTGFRARPSLRRTRVYLILAGGLAIVLALWFNDIIRLMLSAYGLYTAGVASPLVVALLAHARGRAVKQGFFVSAIFCGAGLGLVALFLENPVLTLVGVFLGGAITSLGLRPLKKA